MVDCNQGVIRSDVYGMQVGLAPAQEEIMYNITDKDGCLMLCFNVYTRADAEKWLQHYETNYPPGGEYPNGKGYYPDWQFRIVVFN